MAVHYGNAGSGALQMANKRRLIILLLGLFLVGFGILSLFNFNILAKAGLSASLPFLLFICFGSKFLEKKANYIEKRAKDAERGAQAEIVVADILNNLPSNYHVVHDIPFDGFNIDHVVVGPNGIFLIETKSHRGRIESRGDELRLNGKTPKKDFLKQTWSQTFQLQEFLERQTNQAWKVKPVLCFTNGFVKVRRPVKGIQVVSGRYLPRIFERNRSSLTEREVLRIASILEKRLQGDSSVDSRQVLPGTRTVEQTAKLSSEVTFSFEGRGFRDPSK